MPDGLDPGERERTAWVVTANNAVIDVIDSTTMRRKLGEADLVLGALVCKLIIWLADANKMNEERWLLPNVYKSLAPDEIKRPCQRVARHSSKSPQIGMTFFLR